MGKRVWMTTVLSLAAAGCATLDPTSRLSLDDSGITGLAPGVAQDGYSVDPMIVGNRLMQGGEAELALDQYQRAAAEQGLTPEIEGAMGTANLSLGRLNQAEKQLRNVIDAQPENGRAWNNLGILLMRQGKYAEARHVFERALALAPELEPEIWQNLTLALAKMEQPVYNDDNSTFTMVPSGNGAFRLIQQP